MTLKTFVWDCIHCGTTNHITEIDVPVCMFCGGTEDINTLLALMEDQEFFHPLHDQDTKE